MLFHEYNIMVIKVFCIITIMFYYNPTSQGCVILLPLYGIYTVFFPGAQVTVICPSMRPDQGWHHSWVPHISAAGRFPCVRFGVESPSILPGVSDCRQEGVLVYFLIFLLVFLFLSSSMFSFLPSSFSFLLFLLISSVFLHLSPSSVLILPCFSSSFIIFLLLVSSFIFFYLLSYFLYLT